ncbi:hypothetical protein LDENG_00144750 [Lucifuga dentata]|nr:hypothetical protein LDENG_00144750 [Lucifuga dentata]
MEANGERPPWVTVSPCSPATKTYWSQWKRLYILDGILVRRFYFLDATQFYPQVVLPHVFRPDIMRQMHEGQLHIQSQATQDTTSPMGTVRVGAPMECVALDIMGPLNKTERNNRYVLVI